MNSTAKQWRYAGLKLKPVLYRRNLNRNRRTKARLTLCETLGTGTSKLKNTCRFLFGRLTEGISSAEKQRCYQHESGHAHSKVPPFHPRRQSTVQARRDQHFRPQLLYKALQFFRSAVSSPIRQPSFCRSLSAHAVTFGWNVPR
jgi:hypothetical protein